MSYPVKKAYLEAMNKAGFHRRGLGDQAYRQLCALEATLEEAGIDPRVYVRVSVKLWAGWCKQEGKGLIPIGLIASPKARERFDKEMALLKKGRQDPLIEDQDRLSDESIQRARYISRERSYAAAYVRLRLRTDDSPEEAHLRAISMVELDGTSWAVWRDHLSDPSINTDALKFLCTKMRMGYRLVYYWMNQITLPHPEPIYEAIVQAYLNRGIQTP